MGTIKIIWNELIRVYEKFRPKPHTRVLYYTVPGGILIMTMAFPSFWLEFLKILLDTLNINNNIQPSQEFNISALLFGLFVILSGMAFFIYNDKKSPLQDSIIKRDKEKDAGAKNSAIKISSGKIGIFFAGLRSERMHILQNNIQNKLNDLAARNMLVSSIASDDISRIYFDELKSRSNIAWGKVKELCEKHSITFSSDEANELRIEIKKVINNEIEILNNDAKSKHNLKQYIANIERWLKKARNHIISAIDVDLHVYTVEILNKNDNSKKTLENKDDIGVDRQVDTYETMKPIFSDAVKLSKGSNKNIYNNIYLFENFKNNISKTIYTENQDRSIQILLDVLPKFHKACVAFLKSSQEGQEIYNSISQFVKFCFVNMELTLDNIKIYRSLLSFYYSDYTTIIMLPKTKDAFYSQEYNECLEEYVKINLISDEFKKLKVCYRMLSICEKYSSKVNKYEINLLIDEILK